MGTNFTEAQMKELMEMLATATAKIMSEKGADKDDKKKDFRK